MKTRNDKALRQIRAILAKAEIGSGATEEEASAALQFARSMMLRHQLTDADLGDDESPEDAARRTRYGRSESYTRGGNFSTWESFLGHAIRCLVGTVGYYVEDGKHTAKTERGTVDLSRGGPRQARLIRWYGPEADCRDARDLFAQWQETVAALARLKYGQVFRGEGRSYAEGFTHALYRRAKTMAEEQRARTAAGSLHTARLEERRSEGVECTDLVVVQAVALMDAKRRGAERWLADQGIRLSQRGGGCGGRHHDGAFRDGQHDGRSAAFSRQQQQRRLSR